MFRIDDPTAAAALPAPEAAGTEAYFTEGAPGVNPATLVRASWLNMVQEELRAIVVAGGLTPSKTAYNQVLTAIQTMTQSKVRTRLAANTTFYVATTGSNSNSGLSSGSPFLTIQKAVDTIHEGYDLNGYTATIQVADGTYSAGVLVNNPFVGGGFVNIAGNLTTPANCIISLASGSCLQSQYGAVIGIGGFKVTTTSGSCLLANNTSQINVNGKMEFGAASVAHMTASFRGSITITADYTISGATPAHWGSSGNSVISAGGRTVTLTGTPAVTYMAAASALGYISCPSMTFAGSATGSRYTCVSNGVIDTNGASVTYLPGNTSGATATGGQYV